MSEDRSNEVRERAYRIWQDEGEPHGRDAEHWAQAEGELGRDEAADPVVTADSAGQPVTPPASTRDDDAA